MHTRSAAVVVAIALLVVGTGAIAEASTSAKKVKACDLITPADISKVLTIEGAAPSTQGTPPSATYCPYALPLPNGAVGQLSASLDKYNAAVKKDLPKNSKEPGAAKIPGVKKGFLHLHLTGSAGAIIAGVKGTKFVVIQTFLDSITKDQLVALFKIAYKRA